MTEVDEDEITVEGDNRKCTNTETDAQKEDQEQGDEGTS